MVLDKEFWNIQGETLKPKPNLNCKICFNYATDRTNCDSSHAGYTKKKTILVIAGQPIELIGINRN